MASRLAVDLSPWTRLTLVAAETHSPLTPRDTGGSMKRVTGIGGIFFKANDAPALQAWYKRHLGIDVQAWGGAAFDWTDGEGKPVAGTTAWSIASAQSDQFAPSSVAPCVWYFGGALAMAASAIIGRVFGTIVS